MRTLACDLLLMAFSNVHYTQTSPPWSYFIFQGQPLCNEPVMQLLSNTYNTIYFHFNMQTNVAPVCLECESLMMYNLYRC